MLDATALLSSASHTLLVASCVLIPLYLVYNYFLHPLSALPGPLSARLGIPTFRFLAACQNEYAWRIRDLHLQFGDIVRTGPNTVSIIEPDAVRTIYSHHNDWAKSSFYTAFRQCLQKQ